MNINVLATSEILSQVPCATVKTAVNISYNVAISVRSLLKPSIVNAELFLSGQEKSAKLQVCIASFKLTS